VSENISFCTPINKKAALKLTPVNVSYARLVKFWSSRLNEGGFFTVGSILAGTGTFLNIRAQETRLNRKLQAFSS
jgi:hypothetical protein